ncbi:LacI family DNA-binding transcriptional regulator [Rhodovastum atsumiense]|uniref:LacI family DNA-binding transcriptional regulator n=1 Tax=Rhodovastum atsumiense TaxID=504468 RepID=A0A5M6INE9_9PROT|nr:LacI family DNA-binding transcriptional regulator [Rhodovastum atsumiense]KAA5609088.1 LacI family DNA-binding transcriptional regulator [Rhodovastum atsumiense]CAH2602158.1 LacI family DNA-binding transcriptional regulator [Rhodovastum atsumiense]
MDERSNGTRRRRKMQRVTMTEVAASAGVSPSTVSLYLRKPTLVSPSVGETIGRAIERLGYVPNLVAGGLAAAGSRVVSVIVPSVRNAFFADTVAALQETLAPSGLQVMLGHTDYGFDREETLVRTALSWAPAAIVIVGLEHGRGTRGLLMGAAAPVFEIWECGQHPIDTAVGFQHREVGRAAATHLLARGRRHLAFLGARMADDYRAQYRADGFARRVTEQGAPAPLVLDAPDGASVALGARLLGQALAERRRIDGIACSNDLIALGALFECQRRGIAVPQAIGIVGFGALEFTGSCVPPLTTIDPFGSRIGTMVGQRILARLQERSPSPPQPETIDTGFELVVRDST